MNVYRRSGTWWVIVAGVACAGLLWAAQGKFDRVRGPAQAHDSAPTDAAWNPRPQTVATSGARPRGRAGVAPPSMPTLPLQPSSYSMTAPQFFPDPAALAARSVAVGDISGDGRDDLVFLSLRESGNPINSRTDIYIAYQREDGLLGAAIKIGESVNFLAYQLLIVDFNGDGRGDIVTITVDGVMVLRANADGSFTTSTIVVGDPADLVATDVDRDGYRDILVDSSNTSATVLHGNLRGVIARVSTLPLPASAVRTTGDVTGDGLDDLLLGTIFNRPLEEFHIYPALASGGYAAPIVRSLPLGSNHTASLVVGDFNDDGRGALALDEAKDIGNLRVYLQDALGNLGPPTELARERGGSTESLIAADLNRDGRTDLAIAHSGWGNIGYYLQTPTGLAPETLVNAFNFMGRLNYFATGDLNSDGCGDVVIARTSQAPVLLYGQGCSARPRIVGGPQPALVIDAPSAPTTGLIPPRLPAHNGDAGGDVAGSLTRHAAARFGRR
jgi:hypothetical protein